MKLQPYKFHVQAVVQQIDDDGNVVGEVVAGDPQGGPVTVFGVDGLEEWARGFPERLEELAEQAQAEAS